MQFEMKLYTRIFEEIFCIYFNRIKTARKSNRDPNILLFWVLKYKDFHSRDSNLS